MECYNVPTIRSSRLQLSPRVQVSDALAISPAMAFRYSLEVLLIKCYSACRDNIKRTLSTLLASCVQAPGGMPHEPQV